MILAVSAPHTTVHMQLYNHTVSCVLNSRWWCLWPLCAQ